MHTRFLLPVLLFLLLSACGNKGALTLPPKDLAGTGPVPAAAAKPGAAADHNSPAQPTAAPSR